MEEQFASIAEKHEKEDADVAASEEKILSAARREFRNVDEILRAAKERGLTGRDFFASEEGIADFPVLPVRFSDEFTVHRHTTSQRPYLHAQEFFELIYAHRGTCVQQIRGKDGALFRLPLLSGQLCILPPNSVHSIARCTDADLIFKFIIPPALFEKTTRELAPFAENSSKNTLPEDVLLFEEVGESAEYMLFKILKEYIRDERAEVTIPCCLTLLFAELCRKTPLTDSAFCARLEEYFRAHIQDASLQGFADSLGYSKEHTSRIVKRRAGRDFSSLLRNFRIDRAAEILAESDLSIEDAAYAVGFSSTSALYKQFFARFGMTPREYRKLYR